MCAWRLLLSLATLLAATAGPSCPGVIEVDGYGEVTLVNSVWYSPGQVAQGVDVPNIRTVTPHMAGRAYFGDGCTDGSYNQDWYVGLKLLGKKLKYTTDISGAGCGCIASISLVPMRQNRDSTACSDHYCDAKGLCGVSCNEIGIQNANQRAWHSSLHSNGDVEGFSAGFGGISSGTSPHNFDASQYGPGGVCIDTTRPFEVEASFPINRNGTLKQLEVALSQPGKECVLKFQVAPALSVLSELSVTLEEGATLAISYWGSEDSHWLDGPGADGKGPCQTDQPWQCAELVMFSNFSLSPLPLPLDSIPTSKEQAMALAINAEIVGKGTLLRAGKKRCTNGWMQPEGCVRVFTYKEKTYEGCTQDDFRQAWCSADALYAGNRLMCEGCRPQVEAEAMAEAEAQAEAEVAVGAALAQAEAEAASAARVATGPFAYEGCYVNEGKGRIMGHTPDLNMQECAQAALRTGSRYFGMEDPVGSPGEGKAYCLQMRDLPIMSQTDDEFCQAVIKDGYALGGTNFLAIYKAEVASSTGVPTQFVPREAPAAAAAARACEFPIRFARDGNPEWESLQWVKQASGRVAIRTFHGKFLVMDPDGSIKANRDTLPELGGTFQVVGHADGSISLQLDDGSYLVTRQDGLLFTTPRDLEEQERFFLIEHADGTISLRTWTWQYLVAERSCLPACVVAESSRHPRDSAGFPKTHVGDAAECQARCAAVVNCAHFTFAFSDKSCHLADASSGLRVGTTGSVSGPAACPYDSAAATTTAPTPVPIVAPDSATLSLRSSAEAVGVCDFPIRFDHNAGSGWDTFEWIAQGPEKISLLTFHGKYVVAQENGTISASISTLSTEAGVFDLIWHGDGSFSLKTVFRTVVSASSDGALQAVPSSAHEAGLHQRFTKVGHSDGTATILAWNGKNLVAEKMCSPPCTSKEASYFPLNMTGKHQVWSVDALDCQAQCALVHDCLFFTFIESTRACHFADVSARLQVGPQGAVAGPFRCGSAIQYGAPASSPPLGTTAGTNGPQACDWDLGFEEHPTNGWDVFEWVEQGQNKVSLLTFHDKFVGTEPDGTVRADFEQEPSDAGIFNVVWHDNQTLSFRTANRMFITASADGRLFARSTNVGVREKFTRIFHEDGTVSLAAWTGKRLIAERVCMPTCAQKDSEYLPLDKIAEVTWGGDAVDCQKKCAENSLCTFFTFIRSDRSCHLTGPDAQLRVGQAGDVAGTATCNPEDMMVMRRYSQPPVSHRTTSVQQTWTVLGFVGLIMTPGVIASMAFIRRAFPCDGSVRSVSRGELLPVDEEQAMVVE